jgi:DNA-binding transcriptional LysR family regulator
MTFNSQLSLRVNVEQLRTFLVLSEELNFRRAADRLHMASSPISRRIRELETALNVRLFERDTRHVWLTEAGSALVPLARDVVDRFEALRWSVTEGGESPPAAPVRVGVASGAHLLDAGLLLDTVRRNFPGADVIPEVGTSPMLLPMLRSGYLTCSLVHLPVPDGEIAVAHVRDDELGVAISVDHPLSSKVSVSVADLLRFPFAVLRQRPQPAANASHISIMQNAGIKNVTFIDSDFYSDVASYVASTNAFALIPICAASPLRRPFTDPRLTVRPLEGIYLSLQTGIAWMHTRAKTSPQLQNTIRECHSINLTKMFTDVSGHV